MKKKKTLILIFILFLVLPNILFWFLNDKTDNTNYENRNLSEKPKLVFKEITDYPSKYENYFNDNLAFKNEIRKLRSMIMYKLFNTSSDERVIIGSEGWFFFTGNTTITDYLKTEYYTKEAKKKINSKLLEAKNKLNENNIDLYILILPNKETVYSDKLESKIKRSNNKKSKIDDLIDYLKNNSDLKIIYPKDELIEKRKNYETYYKYDTHWNDYGAYIGIMNLMKEIDSNYEIPKIKVTKKEKTSGDLAVMNLMKNVKNKEPVVVFHSEIDSKCEDFNTYRKCSSENALYDKTLLFVGDSFRNATEQYFSKIYKNVIIIHKNNYNEDFINKYNPDIVIYESVERLSDTFLDIDMLFNQK